MSLCQMCGKEETPNHKYETQINQIVKQYKEQRVSRPIFILVGFNSRILGCHVDKLDIIHVHVEQYYSGLIGEQCIAISEEKARYILHRLKREYEKKKGKMLCL